jgi:hypothetical protein
VGACSVAGQVFTQQSLGAGWQLLLWLNPAVATIKEATIQGLAFEIKFNIVYSPFLRKN